MATSIQQLRIYDIVPSNIEAFHNRFRDHAWRIMKRHGFDILAFWDTSSDGKTEFAYLLEWEDEQALEKAWDEFMADEEWKEIKRTTGEEHGDFVNGISDRVLHPTDYSPQRVG
jgi:NIPSNAP